MEQWVIHATVEVAGHITASGNFMDHSWSTIEACKDFMNGFDQQWIAAKEWLTTVAGPGAAINYECITNATKS